MSAADASIRSRIARMGGSAAVAKHGGKALTAKAREVRQTKLNADLCLEYGIATDDPEYDTRLTAARRKYCGAMALRRSK